MKLFRHVWEGKVKNPNLGAICKCVRYVFLFFHKARDPIFVSFPAGSLVGSIFFLILCPISSYHISQSLF